MRIKTKTLKKLVAVLCAATMVASGAVASVGAVNNADIDAARKQVGDVDATINQLKERIKEIEKRKEELIISLDEQIKKDTKAYENILREFEQSGQNDEKELENKYKSIEENKNLKQEVSDGCKVEISNIEAELEKAAEEKTKLEKNVKSLLEQAEKEYKEAFKKFIDRQENFMKWIGSEEVDDKDDTTKENRMKVLKLNVKMKKNFDAKKAEEVIKLAEKTMNMMDNFKAQYQYKRAEEKGKYEKFAKEFEKKSNEFMKHLPNIKIQQKKELIFGRLCILNTKRENLSKKFNREEADQFVKDASGVMNLMDNIKKQHEGAAAKKIQAMWRGFKLRGDIAYQGYILECFGSNDNDIEAQMLVNLYKILEK